MALLFLLFPVIILAILLLGLFSLTAIQYTEHPTTLGASPTLALFHERTHAPAVASYVHLTPSGGRKWAITYLQ